MTSWDLVTLFTKERETKQFYKKNPDEDPSEKGASMEVFSLIVVGEFQMAFDVRIFCFHSIFSHMQLFK